MNTETLPRNKVHHGRNVKRFREMLGIKQEILAEELGLSQQTISRFEANEELEDDILNKIAKVLKVPTEAIKSFNDEGILNIFSNTFDNASAVINNYPTFNPIDKLVELYERMLKAEQEKVAMLEKMLAEKK